MAEPFRAWLKRTRLEKGLTQEELTDLIGAKHPTVQRYESGERQVNFDVALQLADALSVPRAVVTLVWVQANGGELPSQALEDLPALPSGARILVVGADGMPVDLSEDAKQRIDFDIKMDQDRKQG